MLVRCNEKQIREVLSFIGEDKLKCFYLYMDLQEYGVSDDGRFQLWEIKQNDNIEAIAYVYYDCLHFFSRGDYAVSEISELIKQTKPQVINSEVNTIKHVCELYHEGSYKYEENYTITIHNEIERKDNYLVIQANEKDLPEITSLMIKDPVYSKVYSYDKLLANLSERMQDGTGRTFFIKDEDGTIVATNSTYVETDELGVVGGLVTDPKMRGKGLGRAITAHTWNLVRKEGKQGVAYLEAENENTLVLHRKMGFEFINHTARIIMI